MDNRLTLTPEEAASALNVSVKTIYNWCKLPGFPAVRAARKYLIPIDALNCWLKNKANQGADNGASV